MTRTPQAHTLAAAAALAGTLQLVATLELSMSSEGAVVRAIREGPTIYLGAAAILAAFAALVVWQRRRWTVAVGLALPGLLAAIGLVWTSGSRLGLSYHGEFLLHHFLALLCAATCVAVPLAWARDGALGRLRALPLLPALAGAGLLLAEHLRREVGAPIGTLGQVGTATLLLAVPLALGSLWPHLQPPRLRAAACFLALPVTIRVALGGSAALAGLPLETGAATPLLIALGLAAVAGWALVRPRAERGLHGPAIALAGVACFALQRAYTQRFGELEVAVGGLARSLFGFDLPYPGYLPTWRLASALLVLFALFSLAVTSLLSRRDHVRGLCLVILMTAGLGLTSPQLALMTGAGLLLALDTLVGAPPPPPPVIAPPRPVEAIVAEAAKLLDLPPPTVLEQQRGAVIALRGELGRIHVDLRARHERTGWILVAQAGTLGRGAPELELRPGDPDDDPHPLLGTHQLRGDPRRVETVPESLLMALQLFPAHRTRLWPGGCQIELGGRLDHLDAASLAAVLRSMSQAT